VSTIISSRVNLQRNNSIDRQGYEDLGHPMRVPKLAIVAAGRRRHPWNFRGQGEDHMDHIMSSFIIGPEAPPQDGDYSEERWPSDFASNPPLAHMTLLFCKFPT